MIIVQNKDEIVRYGCDFIKQGCQDRFNGWWSGEVNASHASDSNILIDRLQEQR